MVRMDSVVHFEMGYKDAKRVIDFYTGVFGWNLQVLGAEMGDYIVAHTAETDVATSMVKTPGTINGGFYKTQDIKSDSTNHVVIAVENLKTTLEKVTTAGGTIKNQPMPIPGIGDYASIIDTEGNPVGVLQPSPMPQ
jgi:predicted enzyme related to lactoylglutathione lyase